MKKIECQISDEKSYYIDKVCEKEGYTRAEFNRRALELYLLSLQGINTSVSTVELLSTKQRGVK